MKIYRNITPFDFDKGFFVLANSKKEVAKILNMDLFTEIYVYKNQNQITKDDILNLDFISDSIELSSIFKK